MSYNTSTKNLFQDSKLIADIITTLQGVVTTIVVNRLEDISTGSELSKQGQTGSHGPIKYFMNSAATSLYDMARKTNNKRLAKSIRLLGDRVMDLQHVLDLDEDGDIDFMDVTSIGVFAGKQVFKQVKELFSKIISELSKIIRGR